MNGTFYVPPLTVLPVFADGQSRRESPKMASRPFQFLREYVHKFGTFCPEVRRRTRDGAFIYALSADETSPALAAPRHAITALFSCRFKCPCPPCGNRIFVATSTERITHYTLQAKSCAKGNAPLETPDNKTG